MDIIKNKYRPLQWAFKLTVISCLGVGVINLVGVSPLGARSDHDDHDRHGHDHVVVAKQWWDRHRSRYPHEKFIVASDHARYFRYVEHNRPYFRIFFDGPYGQHDPMFRSQVTLVIEREYGRNYVVSYVPVIEEMGGFTYYRYRTHKGGTIVVRAEKARWDTNYEINLWLE